MSFHCEKRNARDEKENMEDITSDFVCFKISALKKAAHIWMAEINNVIIDPQLIVNKNDITDKVENIQDEQNSCNIKDLQKINTSPKYQYRLQMVYPSQSKRFFRKVSCKERKKLEEEMEKLHMSMAHECEHRNAENLTHMAEEECIAKEEEMKKRHEQQLHAQRIQEQKRKLEREMQEYRKRMKEKEELIRAIVIQRGHLTAKYCDIVSLFETCKDKHVLSVFFASNGARIKELCHQIEAIDEKIRKNMEHRLQCMNENSHIIKKEMEKLHMSMAHERESKNAENMVHILAEEERIAKEEKMRQYEQQLHTQHVQEQTGKLEREIEEYRKRMKEKEELIRAIVIQRGYFAIKYCDIMSLSKTCKNKHALNIFFASNGARIKELYQQIEAIDEKIRSGDVVATDVNSIETLVHHIEDILSLFRTEMEQADTQYEAELARKAQTDNEIQAPVPETESTTVDKVVSSQQLAESDTAEKESKDQSTNVVTNQEIIVAPVVSNATNALIEPSTSDPKPQEASKDSAECKEDSPYEYVDYESLNIYNRRRQFLTAYRQSYKDFLQSLDTKKLRFKYQKAINITVNAISGTSEQHLRDKYNGLERLLTGKSSPSLMQHPQGMLFCKDYVAKKIVNQGEILVSSKLAFSIAAVVVALWNQHSDFGELVLTHLHEACPFTVPIFPLQQKGQSNEDYYKSLGCKYSEDGTFENQDMYLKRMSGFMRLYGSIIVTRQRKGINKIHPHGLQYAWRWLAAVLNIEPRADTCDLCATLILDMLEIAGDVLWIAYPNQFHKLLVLLTEQYYPRMQNVAGTGSGPLMRLEEFLNNALVKGTIHLADGMLPPNFW